MKAPAARHERHTAQSIVYTLCLFSVLISVMSLGSMRLYGLYLEHRIALVTERIEAMMQSNAEYEERCSALLSPSRIYNYAKSQLNMVTAQEVETIRLYGETPVVSVAEARPQARPSDMPDDGLTFLDFIVSFAGVANAQD